MLALEVEYLMGRVLASQHDDRQLVEWPPNPARLFAALVAAYEECELDDEARAALEWLERLQEPSIYVDPPDNKGWMRDTHDVFVPVNDVSHIPERRSRQVRWFPAFTPQDRHVWFVWNNVDDTGKHASALQRIAENVTYLGHSMSPVRVRLSDSPPAPTLVPDSKGPFKLRTTGKGRLQHLEEVHQRRKENTTIQPRLGKVTSYQAVARSEPVTPRSLFTHGFVLGQEGGPSLPLESTAKLIETIRKAILAQCNEPIPEMLSGHAENSEASGHPHLAITPLANVGHRHADGRIMGVALWLPQSASSQEYEQLDAALASLDEIKLGRLGVWRLQRVIGDTPKKSLWLSRYSAPSETWASVTPVVFGKFPKKSQVGPGKNGGKVFAELCEMIGLPAPVEARLGPVSAVNGSPKSADYKAQPKQADGRLVAHVLMRFPEPVRGPVLMGAGRFVGFGLCRPWDTRRARGT